MSNIIRQNADGSPWTAVRKINGRSTLVAAIRGGNKWTEVPASKVIGLVSKTAPKQPTKSTTDRKAATAAALREITDRYAFGKAR